MDDQWVEIFKNLELTTIPIKYLHSVRITFNDNKIWDIDVKKSKLNNDNTNIEESLYKLFEEYEDTIQDIDLRLDTKKIKKDIQKKTTTFLKKRK
jgi:hypothetical protein